MFVFVSFHSFPTENLFGKMLGTIFARNVGISSIFHEKRLRFCTKFWIYDSINRCLVFFLGTLESVPKIFGIRYENAIFFFHIKNIWNLNPSIFSNNLSVGSFWLTHLWHRAHSHDRFYSAEKIHFLFILLPKMHEIRRIFKIIWLYKNIDQS